MIDCTKVWATQSDRERVPACNPALVKEMPHVTFFMPFTDDDGSNKMKDIPYHGILSVQALTLKSKELLECDIKSAANSKEMKEVLNSKQLPIKLVLFSIEDSEPLYFRIIANQFRGKIDVSKTTLEYSLTNHPPSSPPTHEVRVCRRWQQKNEEKV